MKINILTFGITREILNSSELSWDLDKGSTIDQFRLLLQEKYPGLIALNSLFIAVNEEYAEGNYVIQDGDNIALIPPVSGG
jgi:molybdopterin converting factor subunit 1